MTEAQREKQGSKGRVRIISDQVQIGRVVITPRERRERKGQRWVEEEVEDEEGQIMFSGLDLAFLT